MSALAPGASSKDRAPSPDSDAGAEVVTPPKFERVQRDQCSGATMACVNCGIELGGRHDILCYGRAKAQKEFLRVHRATHDCERQRCNTDTRTDDEIEAEGHAAGLAGADYHDVPYGHTHPDLRFSIWERGRWKARGEWCDNHGQPFSWCPGFPDMDMDPAEGPCSEVAS